MAYTKTTTSYGQRLSGSLKGIVGGLALPIRKTRFRKAQDYAPRYSSATAYRSEIERGK